MRRSSDVINSPLHVPVSDSKSQLEEIQQQSGQFAVTISKTPTKRQRLSDFKTNYLKCIICQETVTGEALYNVTSAEKLTKAVQARQDDVAKRLIPDMDSKSWIENLKPQWHPKCRNIYTQEKLYKIAKEKRETSDDIAETSHKQEMDAETLPEKLTRSAAPSFKSKTMCVICGKERFQGEYATSKVSVPDIKHTIINIATSLKRNDILNRLAFGDGYDLVASDCCYHRKCMNRFRATRQPVQNRNTDNVHDVAFSKLVTYLDQQLFKEHRALSMKDISDLYHTFVQEPNDQNIGDHYRPCRLQNKVTSHYGSRVSLYLRQVVQMLSVLQIFH